MDFRTCIGCGTSNEFNANVCKACGSKLFSSTPPTLQPDDIPTLPIEDSNRAFGFGDSDLEFAHQGVSATAVEYLENRFQPISRISSGGMGKIFLVQERLSGRFVALKVMLERAAGDPSLVQQFVREAVISARLQHPHIIPVYELGFLTQGQLYYTMRYVDGSTFDDIAPKVDLDERLRILRSAAMAVDHAHEQGLWHRDVKPNNILVGSLGDTYVIDWGLVSVQPQRDYHLNLPRIILDRDILVMPDNLLDDTREAETTMTGRAVGTPAYMSPEQIACEDSIMGSVSDVWAFGIMLFQAITGRHPVENVALLRHAAIFERIMYHDIHLPMDISDDIPDVLVRLCEKMLKRSPSERMQTLSEFINDLTQYLKSQGTTIAAFGTFSQLSNTKSLTSPEISNHKKEDELAFENRRLKEKVKLLVEIAQLSVFSHKRRKELWRALGLL